MSEVRNDPSPKSVDRPEDVAGVLRRAGLRSPRTLSLAITSDCNLSCDHCMVESPGAGGCLTVPTVERLLREFADLGGREVCLTGGEPLLHPSWLGLVRTACVELGFDGVRVQTNAVAMTARSAELLAALDCPALTFQVSLEGARPASHDRVRGKGSFKRALRGIRHLTDAGLERRTTLAFTEMQHNMGELPAVLALAERLGVGRVVSASLVRHGRARGAADLLPPQPRQYRELVDLYLSDHRFRALYDKLGSAPALEWWKGAKGRREGPCTLIENPYVTVEGRVYPCVLLHEERYAAEGLLTRPLGEVVREAVPRWMELMELSRRRLRDLEACSGCPGRLPCAGGCMGRACSAYGEPLKPEDRCGLRRAVYGAVGEGAPGPRDP